MRSVAVPVRDGTGTVRAAMNVTVHAAETSTETLLDAHLPRSSAPRATSAPTGRSGSRGRTSRS